ncbi:DoxX family protein [Neorhizobium sp. P12A]|uniref:DoxX family protein n=1 Tax=Neorhizobium sp. P12A TaxID=2268027 RepID=UPI0011EE37EB|nr:DoxX family protein [Neorhizobium sp. P12A]KAA0700568.1 DoxX family protein [Neorhizobium sp. P12A]
MSYVADSTSISRPQRIAGLTLTGLVVAFLTFDGVIKLIPISAVTETMTALGYSGDPMLARGLGVLTLVCALLYAIPRTSIVGAILLTGLMGGATATHLRVGSPIFSHLLFGLYLGLMVWGGLYLRCEALRRLVPFKTASD